MTEKILSLSRSTGILWICNVGEDLNDSSSLYDITHVTKGQDRSYFVYTNGKLVGCIANVKEVRVRGQYNENRRRGKGDVAEGQ